MKENLFLNYEKPVLTCMVQAHTAERVKELIDLSLPEGAEAFGMQFCRMRAGTERPKSIKCCLTTRVTSRCM